MSDNTSPPSANATSPSPAATPPAGSASQSSSPARAAESSTPPRTRGYFNQEQLQDLELAETVLTAARAHPAEMTARDITEEWIMTFSAAVTEARHRASGTSQGPAGVKKAVTAAELAAKNLATALKQIQSAAKQKHRMLAQDSYPATHFPTDGYLIGRRFEASRALLLQSADALIARASADSLPGFRTPEAIATVEALLEKYRATEDDQQDATLGKENSRISRDALIESINHRRAAIQHAADAAWPPSEETNRPTRKTFSLPLHRSLGL